VVTAYRELAKPYMRLHIRDTDYLNPCPVASWAGSGCHAMPPLPVSEQESTCDMPCAPQSA
jgi:hypothetical protein